MIDQVSVTDPSHVIGLGLPQICRQHLRGAFPHATLYPQAPDPRAQNSEICALKGSVVLFTFLPGMPESLWIRTSALFNDRAVKRIGVHPRATTALYDRALKAEFAGVLNADTDALAYRRAALSVQAGELWFPRGYLSERTRAAAAQQSSGGLSLREQDILTLLAGGITNQSIADSLNVGRDAVRWHLRSIYAKLGVSDRNAALRLAQNKVATPTPERSQATRKLATKL